jgi:hypothetical protein
MRDSDTYWAIFEEGQAIQAREIILRLGAKRFGAPDAGIAAQLEEVSDLARLGRIVDRLFDATAANWHDLLNTP